MSFKFIAVEGNIGAGKTTLAKALAQELNAELVLEEFENNKALRKFYEHINTPTQQTYALASELQFLIDRFIQLKEFSSNHSLMISDYSPEKSRLFAKMNLSPEEFMMYDGIFQLLTINLPQPDCIIYLERNASVLHTNIKKRARNYEQSIDSLYLQQIEREYTNYLQEIEQEIVVFRIDENYQVSKILELINNVI
jgi:deoxyguanosine kinase